MAVENKGVNWAIVANFSSLTRQANSAAKALRNLEEERKKAARSSGTPVVSDKENDALAEFTAHLQMATQARRDDAKATRDQNRVVLENTKRIQDNAAGYELTADALKDVTQARQDDTAAIQGQADAMKDLGSSTTNTNKEVNKSRKAFTDYGRSASKAARSVGTVGVSSRAVTRSVVNLSNGFGRVGKAIDDITPSSRSYALIMRMIPLTAVTSGFNSLVPAINGVGGALVGLMGTIGPVFGMLGAMPGLLAGVAGGIGGAVAGLSSTFGTLQKYKDMQEAQEKASIKAQNKSNRQDRNRQRQLERNVRDIDRARRDQADAARDVADAEEGLADTLQNNSRRIASAEEAIAEAQADSRRAQQAVTEARRDAQRQLEDYRKSLRGMAMDEESAVISLQEARAKLAQVRIDPASTQLERQSADLAVRQAELRLQEVREANSDLTKEAEEAQRKGVEGSDAVVEAKEREADANKRVSDAQQSLQDTYRDNAKSTRDAERRIESANRSYEDSIQRIADLQQSHEDLQEDIAETGNAASDAAEEIAAYEKALAELSPAARELVEELIAVGESWKLIKSAAEEAIAPGVLSALKDLQQNVLPMTYWFLERMAEGTGEWFEKLGLVINSRRNVRNLNATMDDAYAIMERLGDATLNVYEWLIGIGAAARMSGLGEWFGDIIEGWTRAWKEMVDTPEGLEGVARGFQDTMHYSELWGVAIRETWRFLRSFFRNFRPLGEWMLENITEWSTKWNEWLDTDAGQDKVRVWQDLARVNLSGLSRTIRAVMDQGVELFDLGPEGFQRVWDAIAGTGENTGLINALGDLLGIVTEDMIINMIGLGEAIAGVLQAMGETGGMDAVITFVGLLESLASAAEWILRTVPGAAAALMTLVGVASLKKFTVALGNVTGLTGILGAVATARNMGYVAGDGLARASAMTYFGAGNFVPDQTTAVGLAALGEKRVGEASKLTSQQVSANKAALRTSPASTSSIYRASALAGPAVVPLGTIGDTIDKQTKQLRGPYTKAVTGVGKAFRTVGGLFRAYWPVLAITSGIALFSKLRESARQTAPELEEVSLAFKNFSNEMEKGAESGIINVDNLGAYFDEVFSKIKQMPEETAEGVSEPIHTLDTAIDRFLVKKRKPFATGKDLDAINDTFRLMDEELTNLPLDQAAQSFEYLRDRMELKGATMEEILETYPEYVQSVRLLAAENGILSKDTDSATLSNEELFAILQGQGPLYDELAEKLGLHNDELEDQHKNLRTLADDWRENKRAIDEWKDAIDRARGVNLSISEAQDRATLSALDSEERIKEVEGGKRVLHGDTRAAIDNRTLFRDWADDINSAADAMLEAKVPIDEVNAYIAENRERLLGSAEAFDLGNQKVGEFGDSLRLVPREDVVVGVLVETPLLSAEEIAIIEEQLRYMDETDQIEIKLVAQEEGFKEAMEMMEALGALSITVPVDIGGARGVGTRDKSGNLTQVYFPDSGLTMRAEGGPISGPGTSTSDSIPALLSDGEYVIKTRSVRGVGEQTLDYINRTGRLPKYRDGGMVKRYATGGKVSGGDSIAAQASVISNTFSDLGRGLGTWGQGVTAWWGSVWRFMSATASIEGTRLSGIWNSTLGAMVAGNRAALGMMTADVTGARPTMGAAWRNLMNEMRTPIKDGIEFVNGTLGNMVTQLASFYGITDTPFPISTPGFKDGGWTGSGTTNQPAGIVHADEYVVKKSSRQRMERSNPGALDYINRTGRMPGYAVGGRVVPVRGRESGNYKGHSGIDWAAPTGTPVYAASDGVVSSVKSLAGSFGKHIVQNLAGGMKAVYAHLSAFNVQAGDMVRKGQLIGRVGSTGRSTGPHLHFEISAGSFGREGNRSLTRQWLDGAPLAALGMGDGQGLAALSDLLTGGGAIDQFMDSVSGSGWGTIVGTVITDVARKMVDGIHEGVDGMITGVLGDFGYGDRRSNAFGIIDIALKRGLGKRGALLGLMAAMQESGLKNINYGDRDSVGLFQQRPSSGWGSAAQIMDPSYATNKFYDALVRLNGWKSGPEWEDIQAVQISAFPRAYQKHKSAAVALLNDYMMSKAGFSGGGWTGPGSTNTPAGIVHADEYVIRKSSRKRIEQNAPGMLDYINEYGTLPGYASGGRVAASAYKLPTDLRGFTVYLHYLQKAQENDLKNARPLNETKRHARIIEMLLANEGLLNKKYIDGHLGPAEKAAWKKWQESQNLTGTGMVDYDSYTKLLKRYRVPFNSIYPFTPGYERPTKTDVITGHLRASNKQMDEFMGHLNKLRGWGFTNAFDALRQLGPTGIPEEYRDSIDPLTGMEMAKSLSSSMAAARKYEEALKDSKKYDNNRGGGAEDLMAEMVALLSYGENSPYGLSGIAKELQISIDTAAMLFKKLNSQGTLKDIATNRTARIRGDVADFDNLFKFNKGGIVPGVGNTDSVFALLTPGELVVPKDVVNSMFSPQQPNLQNFSYASRVSDRTDTSGGQGGNVYNFNTQVYNPVAEESSASVQKRVRNVALTGILGRTEG